MDEDIGATSEETGVCKTMKSVISYQVFVLEQKNKLHGKYPFLKAHQINRKLKSMWDAMSHDDQSSYRKFTLISTPTPPKKVAKNVAVKRSKTCKGRLLTPKSCNTFSAKKTPAKSPAKPKQSPVKPVKDIVTNPVILDQWDQKLLGPYLNSDDDMSDGGNDDDDDDSYNNASQNSTSESILPVHWKSKIKTYDGCLSIEKNYPVPTVVGMSTTENLTRTPGILKREGKETKCTSSRVSFSTEEVDVKIMSEREDSCSTFSASLDLSIPSPQALPESDENPYDFDAIDKFEICVSTPQKSDSGITLSQKETTPVVENIKSKPLKKNVPTKRTAPQRGGSRKKTLSSPVPAKRMLRSRSPNIMKYAIPDEGVGAQYVYKFDEMSSPPCSAGESGRGDAEESFHEPEGSKESSEVNKRQANRCLVHSGGDSHIPCHSATDSASQITPKQDKKTESSAVAVAPKKRKQLTRTTSMATPKQVSKVIFETRDSAYIERRRSPRLKTQSVEVEDSGTPSEIKKTSAAKKNPRKCKPYKIIVEAKENFDSNKEDFGFDMFGTSLEEEDNPWITTAALCPPKVNYVDDILAEGSSESDVGLSPVLLQAKSQLSVAETLRGLKMITSPDNQDFSDSSVDCPKLLSPSLSDISLLSSVSSTAGNYVNGKGCTTLKSNVFSTSEIFQGLKKQLKKKPQQPCEQSRQPKSGKPMNEPLCDMFENMTPPDLQIISSRRLLSSCGREGTSNFDRLFEEDDIFG